MLSRGGKGLLTRAGAFGASGAARLGLPVLPPTPALIEIAVLILPLTLINVFTTLLPPLPEIQPHPFWLPVLLLSLQYGTPSGLLAAAVAILATLYLGLPVQEVGENHFNYTLRVWAQPTLWLAAAVILGQFRLRQIEAHGDLRRSIDELTSQRNAIADYSTNLRARCDALERFVATERSAAKGVSSIDALSALMSTRIDDLPATFGAAAEVAIGTCKASLFVNTGDSLRLSAAVEWPSGPRWATVLLPTSALYRAIVVEGRTLSVLATGDEIELDGQGILAVPILAPTSERVIGMIKIEEIEPARLDDRTPARLAVLASLVAPSLDASASLRVRAMTPVAAAAPRRIPSHPRIWRRLFKKDDGPGLIEGTPDHAATRAPKPVRGQE